MTCSGCEACELATELADERNRCGKLEDALRDILDYTTGWHRPHLVDAEMLDVIRRTGEAALESE